MPSLVDSRFGELLRHYRLAAGLTQEALAEQAGLSVHGSQKLARGGSQPHRETLRRLISVLALAPDDEAVFRSSGQPAPRSRGAVESLTSWRGPEPPDLPTPLTSFIGREQEIADFAELLSSVRLLTL